MANHIIDIINISSADNWFFGDDGDFIEDSEPVACFALVVTIDTEHPTISKPEKIIVAVPADSVCSDYLIGSDIEGLKKPIVHRSKMSVYKE